MARAGGGRVMQQAEALARHWREQGCSVRIYEVRLTVAPVEEDDADTDIGMTSDELASRFTHLFKPVEEESDVHG